MPRVKRGVNAKKKRRTVLERAKGYYGAKSRTYRAAKEQVQQMVKALLNLPEIAQEDAADALGVAICHAHSRTLNQALTLTGRR